MSIKLKKLQLVNFAKFDNFEIEYSDQITKLSGFNGAGKTTVGLTGIWAALKGIAEKGKNGPLIGERFRFIGTKGKTAKTIITLIDTEKDVEIVVKNTISKSTNSISFEASDENYIVNQAWLNEFFNVAFLSAKNFCAMSSIEQALRLGIDTSDFDNEIDISKEKAKGLRAILKSKVVGEEPEKVEGIALDEMLKDRQKHTDFNTAQGELAKPVNKANELLETLNAEIEEDEAAIKENEESIKKLKAKIKEFKGRVQDGLDYIKTLDQPEEIVDLTDLDKQILEANQDNSKVEAHKVWKASKADHDEYSKKLKAQEKETGKIEANKLKYIKGKELPFDELTIDEKGGLLLQGRPIKEPLFSKGELEKIVAKLHAATNPDFKVRFIDDFESLDKDNQEDLVNSLLEDGFQVITAEVGESKGENYIEMRDCQIIDKSGKESKKPLL